MLTATSVFRDTRGARMKMRAGLRRGRRAGYGRAVCPEAPGALRAYVRGLWAEFRVRSGLRALL